MARRRISNPYEAVSHKTERTAAAKLAEAMNQIIREENLPLGGAEVETGGSDTKFPDVVLHTSPSSSDVLVVFEAKPPAYNPLNEDELKEPARRKATERKARFFCTTNFKELWCFITEEVNKMAEPARQVFQRYRLSGLEDLNKIDEPAVRSSIYRALSTRSHKFGDVYVGAGRGRIPSNSLPYLTPESPALLSHQAQWAGRLGPTEDGRTLSEEEE